jgi:Trk-type K+ transport system membrane component
MGIDEGVETEAHNYTILYLMTLILGTLLCCFLPSFSVEEATYEFASALSGTGLSIVDLLAYGSAYPVAYPYMLWILSIGMFIGRLEILPIYYAGRNIVDEIAYYKKTKKDKEAPLARGE